MNDTVANLTMNEAETIKESAHSEHTQSTEITPEEKMDQIVDEIQPQQSVINQSVDVFENEKVEPDDSSKQTDPEPFVAEETSSAVIEPVVEVISVEDDVPDIEENTVEDDASATEDIAIEVETMPAEETAVADETTAAADSQSDDTQTTPSNDIEDFAAMNESGEAPIDESVALDEPAEDFDILEDTIEDSVDLETSIDTGEQIEDIEDSVDFETSMDAGEDIEDIAESLNTEEELAEYDDSIAVSADDLPLFEELPTTPDNYCGDLQEVIEDGAIGMIKKQAILDEIQQIIDNLDHSNRDRVDKLKQSYYKITKAENDELKQIFIEKGGNEADFQEPEDEFAPQLRALLAQYKKRKAALMEKEELIKEENYAKKLQLIDRMQALIERQDDFNKRYNEFKEIQQKWKEYNPVPHEYARELWRNYQIQNERFYDLVKINNQFRDYDFKKNLELKTVICETVEKLANEPDAISAYHQAQKLFLQWREIGPVSREYRESLWERFRAALSIVNKNHQAHYDTLKVKEEDNLKEKIKLCEIIEAIDFEKLKSLSDWERKTQQVVEIQKKWSTLGLSRRKQSNKVYDRFRTACDRYFKKKSAYYKTFKKDLDNNLQQKRALIEKVESLKERTDWKEVTREVIDIQNEWKKIGPVPRKFSDDLWKEFITACDFFFEQKNKVATTQKTAEHANLAAKKLIIGKIKALDTVVPNAEALTTLRTLIAEWNAIGHVPFKDKDKLYKTFREIVDQQYDRLNIAQVDRKVQQFRSSLTENFGGGPNKSKLHNEREKLMRMYEKLKQELQTYENNVGFFNVSSKGGGTLLKEMENRIERLKNEIGLIVKKIDAIDENLE